MMDTERAGWAKYALTAYWIVLALSTHYPGSGSHLSFSLNDKLLHFLAYALLAILCGLCFIGRQAGSWSRWAVLIAILATYAAADEITQIPIPGRFGDKLDWIADVIGILSGVGLYVLYQAVFRRTRMGAEAKA